MSRRPSIRRYHEGTLAAILLLSFSIGLSSGVFPGWAGFTFLGLSVLLRSQKDRIGFYKTFSILLTAANFAVAAFIGITAYRETQDVVFFFGPFFNSCLGLSLLFLRPRGLDWKLSVSTLMLSITGVIGGGEVLDHLLFIFFCGAFVFYLNATYFMEREPLERLPEGYFRPFVICLVAGWSFGIFIFVFFPRTIQWSNPFGLRDRQVSTGYSGALSLSGASPTPSSALALVVEPLDGTVRSWLAVNGPDLYFRGNALDQFDGLKWHQTLVAASPLRLTRPYKPLAPVYGVKLYREPHSNPWIVYPGSLWSLDLPLSITGRALADDAGNILRSITGYLRYAYTVDFENSSVFSLEADPELSEAELKIYTSVPPEIAQSPYFKTWLSHFAHRAPTEPLLTRLKDLSQHFQKNYKAVLSKTSLSLEKFLGDEKEGHCEYFATVGALSLRSWGFPARVVLGYRGGQFNRLSQVLEVRDENAHAWVEVFVSERGWVRFDPTPLVRRQARFAWMEEVEIWTGAAKYWFSRYVVDYNTKTQTELLLNLGKTGVLGFNKKNLPKGRDWLIAFAAAVGIGLLGRLRWKRWQSKNRPFLPEYYVEFQKRVKVFGFVRQPHESYRAFHSRVVHPEIPADSVKEIDLRLEHDLYAA